jgi:hypothetical protein
MAFYFNFHQKPFFPLIYLFKNDKNSPPKKSLVVYVKIIWDYYGLFLTSTTKTNWDYYGFIFLK